MRPAYGSLSHQQKEDDDHNASTTSSSSSSSSAGCWRDTNIPILMVAFAAALASGGPTYAFGLYATQLKAQLHLTQSQLDTVSAANFAAGLVSWIPGLAVDAWGSRTSMVVGGTLEAVALTLYYAACRRLAQERAPPHVSVAVLSVLGFGIFVSNALVIGALFKMMVQSCHTTKGSGVGAAKGFLGLGAGVYAVLFDALQLDNNLDFLLLAACFCLLAIVLPAALLLPGKEILHQHAVTEAAGIQHYRVAYGGLGCLSVLVLATSCHSLFKSNHSHSTIAAINDDRNLMALREKEDPLVVRFILILITWFGPIGALALLPQAEIASPAPGQRRTREPKINCLGEFVHDEEGGGATAAGGEFDALLPPHALPHRTAAPPPPPTASTASSNNDDNNIRSKILSDNYTLVQMLQTGTAWLFCWTCTVRVGSGTLMTNNMGQMVEALHFAPRTAASALALFSVAQAAARVGVGTLSDAALGWGKGIPRPAFLIVSTASGILAHALLAVGTSLPIFVLGVVASGMAFGMIWPLMVLIVGEVFGTKNHGANYMFFDGFTSAIGTVLMSKFLASAVYEANIDHGEYNNDNNSAPDFISTTCYGRACFGMSHAVVVFLSLTCLATSVAVLIRTRNVYQKEIAAPKLQRIRSVDALYGSPYATWRKRDAIQF